MISQALEEPADKPLRETYDCYKREHEAYHRTPLERTATCVIAGSEWLIICGDLILEWLLEGTEERDSWLDLGSLAPAYITDKMCLERWYFWKMRFRMVRQLFPADGLVVAQIDQALDAMSAAERRAFGDSREPPAEAPEPAASDICARKEGETCEQPEWLQFWLSSGAGYQSA